MKTIEQIETEIAALQAELEARKSEPDLSEAVGVYRAEALRAAKVSDAAQSLQDYMEQHHGVCLKASPRTIGFLGRLWRGPSEDELRRMASHSQWQAAQVAAPEPTEAEDLAMAREVYRSLDRLDHVTDVIVAAFKAERKRAGGGK
jgi:hypothetical protein